MNEPLKVGEKFGRLTIIGPGDKGIKWYLTKCECGNEQEYIHSDLVHGLRRRCSKVCPLGTTRSKPGAPPIGAASISAAARGIKRYPDCVAV